MPILPTKGESTPTATSTGMSTGDVTPTTTAAAIDDDDDEVVFVSSENRADRKCAIIIDLDAMPDMPDTEKNTPTTTPSHNTPRTTPSNTTTTTTSSRKRRHRTQRQLFSDTNCHKRTTREAEQRRCGICKTELTFFNVFVGADCRHSFCHDCTLPYLLKVTHVPISCLHEGCNRELHSHAVLNVMETAAAVTDEHRRKRETLQQLYVKHESISTLAYCANSDCATPFDFEPGSSIEDPMANKISCPLCFTDTCARCGVRWHKEMTCKAFGEQLRRQREREAAERAARDQEKGEGEGGGGDGDGNKDGNKDGEEGGTKEEGKNGNLGEEQSKDGDQDKDGNHGNSNSEEGSLQGDSTQGQQGNDSGGGGGSGEGKGSVN